MRRIDKPAMAVHGSSLENRDVPKPAFLGQVLIYEKAGTKTVFYLVAIIEFAVRNDPWNLHPWGDAGIHQYLANDVDAVNPLADDGLSVAVRGAVPFLKGLAR